MFTRLPKIDHDRIVRGIHSAEQRTSGEIRVVVARHKVVDALAAAQKHFHRLAMANTKARNAVLFFLAPRSRNFAVYGDTGVHEKCGDVFWTELANAMTGYFGRGEFTAGLEHGIERAGALLAEHFPPGPKDRNELPDSIEEV